MTKFYLRGIDKESRRGRSVRGGGGGGRSRGWGGGGGTRGERTLRTDRQIDNDDNENWVRTCGCRNKERAVLTRTTRKCERQ